MSTVNNEGNLIFDFVEENGQKAYVAEFKATGPFSLHIERRGSGRITVYQKSYENGKYATVKNVDIAPQDTIIDAEVPGGVFPKWIKIKSSSEVEVAEVTFESESSGGGAGTADSGDWEYYDVSSTVGSSDNRDISMYGAYLSGLLKMVEYRNGVMTPRSIGPAIYAYAASDYEFYSQIAINMATLCMDLNGSYTLREAIEQNPNSELAATYSAISAFPRITKEQFYNLEA